MRGRAVQPMAPPSEVHLVFVTFGEQVGNIDEAQLLAATIMFAIMLDGKLEI